MSGLKVSMNKFGCRVWFKITKNAKKIFNAAMEKNNAF